jgi:hypothetical protein
VTIIRSARAGKGRTTDDWNRSYIPVIELVADGGADEKKVFERSCSVSTRTKLDSTKTNIWALDGLQRTENTPMATLIYIISSATYLQAVSIPDYGRMRE